MPKNAADIKLAPHSGLRLPFPEPGKIHSILILGNTIGMWGYPGEEMNMSRLDRYDAERFAWMFQCVREQCTIEILGEKEEEDYYGEFFRGLRDRYGIRCKVHFIPMKEEKNAGYEKKLNEYIEEMKNTGKKRFDYAIMNPPYANHIGERLLVKTLEISNRVITIQPAAWLFGKRQNKNITKYADANGMEIKTISAIEGMKLFENAAFNSDLGIAYFGGNTGIIHNGKRYKQCSDISIISDDPLLLEFKAIRDKILAECDGNLESHLHREPNTKGYTSVPFEYNPDPEWRCLRMKVFAGNAGKDDFFTCVARDKKEIDRRIGTYKELSQEIVIDRARGVDNEKKTLEYYYAFDNKQYVYNLVNYMQTDFVRGILYLVKRTLNMDKGELRSIPWFDFTDPVFSKTPKEIDDYLFAKYNISNEIRKHLKELLPDYYGIRR